MHRCIPEEGGVEVKEGGVEEAEEWEMMVEWGSSVCVDGRKGIG